MESNCITATDAWGCVCNVIVEVDAIRTETTTTDRFTDASLEFTSFTNDSVEEAAKIAIATPNAVIGAEGRPRSCWNVLTKGAVAPGIVDANTAAEAATNSRCEAIEAAPIEFMRAAWGETPGVEGLLARDEVLSQVRDCVQATSREGAPTARSLTSCPTLQSIASSRR